MKRTPWFYARRDPPVNGDRESQYEWRCNGGPPARRAKDFLQHVTCHHCQWRGLTEKAKEQK